MAENTVSVTENIAATPEAVYALVSDVTRMKKWSPETTSCRWLDGATGPAVGARFRGTNRIGWRKWATICTVTEAEPGKAFAFDVGYGPMTVAQWRYGFEPSGEGTVVTESWRDRRPAWFRLVYPVLVGVSDRAEHNRRGMAATLRALRSAAEHSGTTADGRPAG